MKIYVASSWRNKHHPGVVKRLVAEGHDVYDFRNPVPGDYGFHWSDIDTNWENWTPGEFVRGLEHARAHDGFGKDMHALAYADAVILVLPSGRSSHLEMGWAVGVTGVSTCVYIPEPVEPELMYKMCDCMVTSMDDLIAWLEEQRMIIAEEKADEAQEAQTQDQG